MKLSNILQKIDAGKMLILNIVAAVVAIAASICYGPVGITNPFYLMCCYLTVRALITVLTYDFEDSQNPEFKRNVVYGPLKVAVAMAIVAFAIPESFIVKLFVIGVTGWFLCSGLKAIFSAGASLWEKVCAVWENLVDQKSFKKHMKEVAQTARTEETLSADLADFLAGSDSAGKQRN